MRTGAVFAESDDEDSARARASTGRALMKAFYDRAGPDVDVPADLAIRYGDACAFSGDTEAAFAAHSLAVRRCEVIAERSLARLGSWSWCGGCGCNCCKPLAAAFGG